jgi:hypothetical protein
MRTKITLTLLLLFQFTFAQVNYGTPADEPLPEKLQNLNIEIQAIHFPIENNLNKIKGNYY